VAVLFSAFTGEMVPAPGGAASLYCGEGVNAASDGAFAKITSSMRIPASRDGDQRGAPDQSGDNGILGLIDHTHAAAAQFLDDAVVRDGLADHGARPNYGDAMLGGPSREVNAEWIG
jgi:hypothetical protein